MTTHIRALLFDFDGLILDTETPEVDVWKRIYAEYGLPYPLDLWAQNIGRWPHDSGFDPARHLHGLVQDAMDEEALRIRHRRESDVLIKREPVGKGVSEYIAVAAQLGIRLAVVSSSMRPWIEPHLGRLGLLHQFERIVCADDVPPGRTKPYPDVYLKALDVLGVTAAQAIAFEDSPHGLAAARAAGIFAVAVPNPSTAMLDLGHANAVIQSLADVPLEELLQHVSSG